MNWIKKLFRKKDVSENKLIGLEGKSKTFDKNIELKFKKIWIDENVYHSYGKRDYLLDDELINYLIWEQKNHSKLLENYKFKTKRNIFSENEDNFNRVVFHGSCLSCLSQTIHSVDRCKRCRFFNFDFKKPDLSIKSKSS